MAPPGRAKGGPQGEVQGESRGEGLTGSLDDAPLRLASSAAQPALGTDLVSAVLTFLRGP